MGCIASKQSVSVTPTLDYFTSFQAKRSGRSTNSFHNGSGYAVSEKKEKKTNGNELGEYKRENCNAGHSISFRLGNLKRFVEGEQIATGWPPWLSAVAGEAIHGWIPLKSDSFEKLEKIGQGTYSSVFRARDLETGNIVALKKVRFDNFEPESVRFMVREIQILRRLDQPNIMKLEGIITSTMSCSIYLVFEYMEHDLADLSSCPDIKFSEAQIKCYMKQLISSLEHCHSRNIMHRDIKGANLLVNNDGILKMADFGLANFFNLRKRQPLTSRVVTLWYRPPELLLGSTDYRASVDLWSVGCVFAELLLGKPILQGRTEVEQLHKIFKLCGSPSEEYWRKTKLPHSTLFRPQQSYVSSLRETCKGISQTALNLIETFLSIEPYKRGTASSALSSEYFRTKPYACDPSSLPKYPANKEIDARNRDEAQRKRVSGRVLHEGSKQSSRTTKTSQKLNEFGRVGTLQQDINPRSHFSKDTSVKPYVPAACLTNIPLEESCHVKQISHRIHHFSGPLHVAPSENFAWTKKRINDNSTVKSYGRSISRAQVPGEMGPSIPRKDRTLVNGESLHGMKTRSIYNDP